jgi:hypothetical protein
MSENTRGGKLDRRAFLRGVGAVAVMGGVGLLSDSADARVVPSDATPEQVKDLNSRAAGIAKVIERMGQPVAGLKFHLSKNQNIGSAGHFMVGVEIEGNV